MNPTIVSNFNGDVVEELMTLAVTQNQMVDGGHIYVDDNIQLKRSLLRVRQSNIIQDPAATPVSQGAISTNEKTLEPDPFLVYIEWDPNEFRKLWERYAPTGEFVYTELPAEVQAELLTMLLEGEDGVQNYMGNAILNGDIASGVAPLNKFDGLIVKALADPDVIDVAGAAALTGGSGGNIVEKLQNVFDATREVVRDRPDYKIFMSTTDFEKYRSYLEALANKSIDPTQDAPALFHGRKIVKSSYLPENTMFATSASPNRSSNIWLGVRGIVDYTTIKVAPLQANSDLWFFKMKMSADTQIKWGQDFVLYKP